jgi:hypothetical protein
MLKYNISEWGISYRDDATMGATEPVIQCTVPKSIVLTPLAEAALAQVTVDEEANARGGTKQNKRKTCTRKYQVRKNGMANFIRP